MFMDQAESLISDYAVSEHFMFLDPKAKENVEAVLTAFFRMETIEHFAKITMAAEKVGSPRLLSSREVAKLMAARSRYSVVPPPGGGAELPVTCDSSETTAADHVWLTRSELDALIDEAVRKDRTRR